MTRPSPSLTTCPVRMQGNARCTADVFQLHCFRCGAVFPQFIYMQLSKLDKTVYLDSFLCADGAHFQLIYIGFLTF